MSEVTRLLDDYSNGNRGALDQLLPIVYSELRRLAHSYLRHERQEITLQTTALVHEAYMKLIDQHSVSFQNRAQFFASFGSGYAANSSRQCTQQDGGETR